MGSKQRLSADLWLAISKYDRQFCALTFSSSLCASPRFSDESNEANNALLC